jgi:hypothetical protein
MRDKEEIPEEVQFVLDLALLVRYLGDGQVIRSLSELIIIVQALDYAI